jgi:outer membrane lipoprotein-sorting protein
VRKFALLILVLPLLGCTQLTAEEIAKEMQKRYESIKDMSGEIVVVTNYGGKEEVYKAKFWMKGNKHRGDDGKTLTVSNGSVVWIYDREKNELVRMNFSGEKPQFDYGRIIEELLKSYNIKLLGEEKIDDRECYVIEAEPKAGGAKMKMWVDKEYWYPLKTEMTIEDIKTTVEYRNVSFNSGLSDDLFEFTPPENAKIVEKTFEMPEKLTIEEAQQRVNFTIVKLSYTAGFEFDYAMVFGKMAQLYYKKGDDVMVISERIGESGESKPFPNAEKVKIGNTEGEITEIVGTRMLKFSKNNLEITIAGKLSEDEIVKIAESMV